jgi:hypothetical protein
MTQHPEIDAAKGREPLDVSVVLPVYNEAGHVEAEIRRIREANRVSQAVDGWLSSAVKAAGSSQALRPLMRKTLVKPRRKSQPSAATLRPLLSGISRLWRATCVSTILAPRRWWRLTTIRVLCCWRIWETGC